MNLAGVAIIIVRAQDSKRYFSRGIKEHISFVQCIYKNFFIFIATTEKFSHVAVTSYNYRKR